MAVTREDHIISGVFADRASADRAYDAVHSRGISSNQVSVLMKDETRRKHYDTGVPNEPMHEKRRTAEGAGVGGALGAGLGAVITAALAAGAPITIPGLLIAGPLAGALTGAGAGGVTGTIVGALVGAGMKEQVAEQYRQDIDQGNIVLAVTVHDEADADYIESEWRKYGEKVRRDDFAAGRFPRKTA